MFQIELIFTFIFNQKNQIFLFKSDFKIFFKVKISDTTNDFILHIDCFEVDDGVFGLFWIVFTVESWEFSKFLNKFGKSCCYTLRYCHGCI